MNPLEQVNMCQNYIIFIKLHQDRSILTSKVKLVKIGRISKLKSENGAKFLYASRPKTQCVAPLWACFWGTSWSRNRAHDSFLESPICLLSNPSLFLDLDVIFPSNTSNPKNGFCVCKRWKKGHFEGDFDPLNHPELNEISHPFLSMHNLT